MIGRCVLALLPLSVLFGFWSYGRYVNVGWDGDGCVDKGCVLLTWCIVRRVKLMWMRGGRIYRIIEVGGGEKGDFGLGIVEDSGEEMYKRN
jgi:hypothetical protein